MNSRLVRFCLVLCLPMAFACGGDPGPSPVGDGGTDAGPTDAGADAGADDGGVDDGGVDDAGVFPDAGPPVLCPNGALDEGEECDDGDIFSGDGCSADCKVEPGFHCVEPGIQCEECGNGVIESSEQCDDGALGGKVSGDGCSATCQLEDTSIYRCYPGLPCEICGDGAKNLNEICDNGGLCAGGEHEGDPCYVGAPDCGEGGVCVTQDGDGCSADCSVIEGGFACDPVTFECIKCGNGIVEAVTDGDPAEVCDDGNNLSGDGCSGTCTAVAAGYFCPPTGGPCYECGNGTIEGDETCDDGNRLANDGCSDTCRLEAGFICVTPGVTCEKCGNGAVESSETCDDGNLVSGDGCDATCALEDGFTCTPSAGCARCGDGVKQDSENCDDGALCVGGTSDGSACVLGDASADTCVAGGGVCSPSDDDACKADCSGLNLDWFCDGGVCALCGDGQRSGNETCDDGNTLSGDGCNLRCQLEANYTCYPGEGVDGQDLCVQCGNGRLEAHETCDDSNRLSGDGCAADCSALEVGYQCGQVGYPCAACHDGVKDVGEQCDDGGYCVGGANAGAACSAGVACDSGVCRNFGGLCDAASSNAGTPCDVDADCGGGTCALDGCDMSCTIVPGYRCDVPGEACEECGNGIQEPNEACDDGNLVSGDGCDSECRVESGYNCEISGTCSATRCGDGLRAGAEQCDDNNTLAGDGCSPMCRIEAGYDCDTSSPSFCEPTVCGNSEVERGETCDDGNATPGDGCSASCQVEIGSACPVPGAACVAELCGNGTVAGAEQCDDGNATAGDGCGSTCQLESGWACPVGVSCYETTCGDSLVEGLEACDDGNAMAFDGCSSTCQVEGLYTCEGDGMGGSICAPLVEFVLVRKFTASNINPDGVYYDPNTRSFVGFKQSSTSAEPIELCLDGTYINYGDNLWYPAGSMIGQPICVAGLCEAGPHRGISCTTGADCSRGQGPASSLVDATYDPVSDNVLMLTSNGRLYQLPLSQAIDPAVGGATGPNGWPYEQLAVSNPVAMVVAEDGKLYVLEDGGPDRWVVFLRDGAGATDFATSPSGQVVNLNAVGGTTSGSGNSAVSSSFRIPGSGLIATHSVVDGSLQFVFYETNGTFVGASTLPGTLFSDNPLPTTYSAAVTGADTATDGSGFITCAFSGGSEPCQLFARSCTTDAQCDAAMPGTSCLGDGGVPCTGGACYCTAPGRARNDVMQVDRGSVANDLDVLANDTRSLATCQNNTFAITRLCAFGANCCDTANVPTVSTGTMGGAIAIAADGQTVTYTPAADFCGTQERFSYCAALGGGEVDSADVRVLVECVCGDGVTQSNEQCDPGMRCVGGANAGATCTGDAGVCGAGSCDLIAAEACTADCTFEIVCGDGYLRPGEQCDDGNSVSGDGCSSSCVLETVCGNGIVEGAEKCDDGNSVSGDGCSSSCQCPTCGNGLIERDSGTACGGGWITEQCDDGNAIANDGCSNTCQIETACGNGTLDPGEECDDDNTVAGDGCSPFCTNEPVCGDGVTEGTEQCDDGNVLVGDGCDATCRREPTCGNGILEGAEQCDEGAACSNSATSCSVDADCAGGTCGPLSGYGCSPSCEIEYCGDGIVQAGLGEQCDDGNALSGDGCSNACVTELRCGDGVIGGAEQCDDGGMCSDNVTSCTRNSDCSTGLCTPRSGDGCTSTCSIEALCGDGGIDVGEECDDGGVCVGGTTPGVVCYVDQAPCPGAGATCEPRSGDGCSDGCYNESYCGDGVRQAGEQCDDGGRCVGNDAACTSDAQCGANGPCTPRSDDGCSEICACPRCGDGITAKDVSAAPGCPAWTRETCDDGNTVSGDGCNSVCVLEISGG